MIQPYQPDHQLPWLQQAKPAKIVNHQSTDNVRNANEEGASNYWGEDGFSFGDLIDIINPLQHIPVVSTLYRKITGDEISQGARFAGGMVFGGAIGMVSNVVQAVIEEESGKSAEEHVLALFSGNDDAETQQAALNKPSEQMYQAYATSMARNHESTLTG